MQLCKTFTIHQGLLDDNSTVEPPDPIPNSEVKRSRADGSVGFPHVRVGHRQALILKTLTGILLGFFFVWRKVLTNEVIEYGLRTELKRALLKKLCHN